MRFALGLPTTEVDAPEEFLTGPAIAEMARHAEALGFDAVHVTDHPAGDQQWLETGGHHALDPFVALSFAAGATTTLRVQTHIVVLPYRNPFLTAKSVLSLDVLSGGRLTFGIAAGYLRSEFNALGVDYDERNELFDEALEVMRLALTEDAVAYTGRHFRSRGTTMRPRPVQQPCPPIWIGGNSLRAMRRAVEAADGWCPFPNPASTSPALKTPQLETLDDFGTRVERARGVRGRDRPDGAVRHLLRAAVDLDVRRRRRPRRVARRARGLRGARRDALPGRRARVDARGVAGEVGATRVRPDAVAAVGAVKVLVAGASGVVGYSAVKHFAAVPGCEVVGLSRRLPIDLDGAGTTLVSVDLNDADAARAVVSEHRDVTHLVYAALFEKPGLVAGWRERDQMETNLRMFANLLDPLVAEADGLRHVTLLQGTKAYGGHVATVPIPSRERTPRHAHENFYFLQEDHLLAQHAVRTATGRTRSCARR